MMKHPIMTPRDFVVLRLMEDVEVDVLRLRVNSDFRVHLCALIVLPNTDSASVTLPPALPRLLSI